MQTNPLLIPTTIGDSWPKGDVLLWSEWRAKAAVDRQTKEIRKSTTTIRREIGVKVN